MKVRAKEQHVNQRTRTPRQRRIKPGALEIRSLSGYVGSDQAEGKSEREDPASTICAVLVQ